MSATDEATGEPRVFLDSDTAEPARVTLSSGEAVVWSTPNPQVGSGNEDGAVVVPLGDGTVALAVADGAGGTRGGGRASTVAIEELVSRLRGGAESEPPARDRLLSAFESANETILALGTGAGTTLAVALVEGDTVRCVHVGDSVILVTGQRGVVRFRTVMHSPVGYALEAGWIGAEEALHHDERHLVSNLVGTSDMRIEVGPEVRLRARDTVLIGSDGLFDNVHETELVEIMRKGPLRAAAKRLATLALERMRGTVEGQPSKSDDLTFLLFRRSPKRSR